MRAVPFAALVLVSTVTSSVRAKAPECAEDFDTDKGKFYGGLGLHVGL